MPSWYVLADRRRVREVLRVELHGLCRSKRVQEVPGWLNPEREPHKLHFLLKLNPGTVERQLRLPGEVRRRLWNLKKQFKIVPEMSAWSNRQRFRLQTLPVDDFSRHFH